MLISRNSVKDGEFAWFRNLSQADQQRKKLCGLRQNTQGVLNALRKACAHGYLLALYWRFCQGQLPPQATLAKRARYAKLAKPLSFKVLRQVVENTVGDVVQLVRTLPCRWLESHTVTANSLPYSTECTGNRRIYIYIRMRFASVANARGRLNRSLGSSRSAIIRRPRVVSNSTQKLILRTAVCKTPWLESVPGVRIPPSPPQSPIEMRRFLPCYYFARSIILFNCTSRLFTMAPQN